MTNRVHGMNVLSLQNLSGQVIKQSDQSVLEYRLIDNKDTDFSDQPAYVVFSQGGRTKYKQDAQIKDNVASFKIDGNLPPGKYTIEIVVDDKYLFPSDYSETLRINESSVGQLVDLVAYTSYDDILAKLRADIEGIDIRQAVDDFKNHDHDERYAKLDHKHKEYLTKEDLEGLNLTGNDIKRLKEKVLASKKVIPNNAYSNIPLTDYDFAGVEHIGKDAFSSSNLTGDLVLPDTLISLGVRSFMNNQLTSVTFQGELAEIPPMAFLNNSIASIEFPEGLKHVGTEAFGTNPLEGELTIPETVETIAESAFQGTQLTKVYVPEKTRYVTGFLEGSFPMTTEIIRY